MNIFSGRSNRSKYAGFFFACALFMGGMPSGLRAMQGIPRGWGNVRGAKKDKTPAYKKPWLVGGLGLFASCCYLQFRKDEPDKNQFGAECNWFRKRLGRASAWETVKHTVLLLKRGFNEYFIGSPGNGKDVKPYGFLGIAWNCIVPVLEVSDKFKRGYEGVDFIARGLNKA